MPLVADVMVFRDAEALVVAYLRSRLLELGQSARVATKIPKTDRPDRLVKVTRTGGPRRDLVADSAQITVECWEATGPAAERLAALCRGLMGAMPADVAYGHSVHRVGEVGGPAYFPDGETDLPRYQFTVVVDIRGEVLEAS